VAVLRQCGLSEHEQGTSKPEIGRED